jgi:hypothetical protein
MLDEVLEIWFNNQGIEMTLWDNMKVQLTKFFVEEGLCLLNHEVVAIRLATQGIGH